MGYTTTFVGQVDVIPPMSASLCSELFGAIRRRGYRQRKAAEHRAQPYKTRRT